MPYFDFHCHPGLKPAFSDPATAISPWLFIDAKLQVFKKISISINPLFNEVLNSQSSLGQLFEGNVKLFGLALHSPEQNMAKGLLEKKLVNKGAIPLINRGRLELIADGNHYFQFLQEDLERIVDAQAPASLNGAGVKVLRTHADFDETDSKTIFAFLIVEGLHSFFGDQTAIDMKAVFNSNFESFTDANTVVAINICHIQQNPFCNHAYGIQFINSRLFFPKGKGVTAWGKEVVNRMLEKKILPDIKHMSVQSRWDLYTMLRDPNEPWKYQSPIICTHAGLTGVRFNDRVKFLLRSPDDVGVVWEVVYMKPKSPYIPEAYFNCSSINLYDEDIEAILLSGGLIGISFDQRILGFADENILRNVTIPHDVEYISEHEATFFLGPNPAALPAWTDDTKIWTSDDFENLDPSLNVLIHPLFFMNQVVHILNVAHAHHLIGAEKAAKSICLGSDYDGLINALDNSKQVTQLEKFKNLCKTKLPGIIAHTPLASANINVDQLMEDVFYNNGKDFILNRLRSIGK